MASTLTAFCLLPLFLVGVTTIVVEKPCERVYFETPNDDNFPYNFLQGVYVLLPEFVDGFYRYEMPGESLYFQYSSQHNRLYFGTEDTARGSIGLQANLNFNLSNHNNNSIFNNSEPFASIIRQWEYRGGDKLFYTYATEDMKFVCVSKDIFKCPDQPPSLHLNFTLSVIIGSTFIINNPATDSYNLLPGIFSTNRPVFRNTRITSYLFFIESHWTVGPDYKNSIGVLRNSDNAISPEFIRRPWKINKAGVWKVLSADVRFRCKGFKANNCNNSSCENGGQCFTTSYNESYCQCDNRYTGKMCNKVKMKCGAIETRVGESHASAGPYSPNSLSVMFCSEGFEPKFINLQCVRTSTMIYTYSWKRNVICSKIILTTEGSDSPPPPPEQAPSWVLPVVLPLAIVLQIILPFAHWLCTDTKLCRILSIHFFISLLLWSIFLISCSAVDCHSYFPSLFDNLKWTAVVIIALAFLINCIESNYSNENGYLSSITNCVEIQTFIDEIRVAEPSITMSVTCWHLEPRSKTVHYTDDCRMPRTRIERYEERVETYSEAEPFTFVSWRDNSAAMIPDLKRDTVTRLKVEKEVDFGDLETIACFKRRKKILIDRNKDRDINIAFKLHTNVEGFKEYLMGYVEYNHIPWWHNKTCFWVLTAIGLTWPYRLCLKYKTAKANYIIRKEVFITRQNLNYGFYEAKQHLNIGDTQHVNPCAHPEIELSETVDSSQGFD